MNEYYQKCLSACKILKQHGAVMDAAESNCELSYMSASKLLYYFAIDSVWSILLFLYQ